MRLGSDDLEARGDLAQGLDRGRHEPRVEGTRDLQRDHARARGRCLAQRLEGGERAGDDDLAASVEVGGLEPELVEPRQQFGLVRRR